MVLQAPFLAFPDIALPAVALVVSGGHTSLYAMPGEGVYELLGRTLIWNQQHLLSVRRDYETHHNKHRPHRSLGQAAPLKPLPSAVADLDTFRLRRHHRVSGVVNEYALAG